MESTSLHTQPPSTQMWHHYLIILQLHTKLTVSLVIVLILCLIVKQIVWIYPSDATTLPPTHILPTTVPSTTSPPFECFVEGLVFLFFNDTLDGQLSRFQGTFEICIGGFYGSVCDIGWNQAAAQTLCQSQFGSRYGSYIEHSTFDIMAHIEVYTFT